MKEVRFSVPKGKGHLTFRLRPSRASEKTIENESHRRAREIIEKIYPELKGDYWLIHMVHHIDKNPFNNNPNNLAIILKSEHKIYHLKKYVWEDKVCPRCKNETVHLNNRCTICHYKNKRSKSNEDNDSKTSEME